MAAAAVGAGAAAGWAGGARRAGGPDGYALAFFAPDGRRGPDCTGSWIVAFKRLADGYDLEYRAAGGALRSGPFGYAVDSRRTVVGGRTERAHFDEKGRPGVVQRAFVVPPQGQIGPITDPQRRQLIQNSLVAGAYEKAVDRESAYEILKARAAQAAQAAAAPPPQAQQQTQEGGGGILGGLGDLPGGGARRSRQSVAEAAVTSAARAIGSNLGRQIVRGVLGSILGGKR